MRRPGPTPDARTTCHSPSRRGGAPLTRLCSSAAKELMVVRPVVPAFLRWTTHPPPHPPLATTRSTFGIRTTRPHGPMPGAKTIARFRTRGGAVLNMQPNWSAARVLMEDRHRVHALASSKAPPLLPRLPREGPIFTIPIMIRHGATRIVLILFRFLSRRAAALLTAPCSNAARVHMLDKYLGNVFPCSTVLPP